MVDPMRLRQILLNLLSNACKFTKAGRGVAARAQASVDGRDWIEFAVARHRHRHDAGAAGQAVRGIHPGRFVHRAPLRRHRARARHHPQARAHDGRRRDGDQRARQGLDLHGAAAGRSAAEAKARAERPKATVARRAPAASSSSTTTPTARELIRDQLTCGGLLGGHGGRRAGRPQAREGTATDRHHARRDDARPRRLVGAWRRCARTRSSPKSRSSWLRSSTSSAAAWRSARPAISTKPIDRERLNALVQRFRSPARRTRILLVEDDAMQRERVRAWLEGAAMGRQRGG